MAAVTGHRRLLPALAAAAAALALLPLAASPAAAEDAPTSIELLEACGVADYCEFHQTGETELYTGDVHQVGSTLDNCGPGSATKQITWIDTTAETNSLGISLVQESEFWTTFKEKFEITYGHKWGTSESTNRTTSVTVEAGQKAWLVRSTPMQRITGTYELHFADRFHGHYYWYVPFTVEGAAPETVDVVSQHSEDMTEAEEAQCS